MAEERKKLIHRIIIIAVIILIPVIISILIVKYQVEGEQNMPFELTKITVVSNAEGREKKEDGYRWAMDLIQNNDVYLTIEKNKDYQDTELIDKITLENFQLETAPKIGKMQLYRPSADKDHLYEYKEEYYVQDNKLEYVGDTETNVKNLEISNQGGMILFRYANQEVGELLSNENEIAHDGKMLKQAEIPYEDLKGTLAFDIIIATKSKVQYKATIRIEIPAGNILEEGRSYLEKTDSSDIVFKRI
ncbi:MAG: hypothetical protein ACLU8F_05270 [Clostridia bacterium]